MALATEKKNAGRLLWLTAASVLLAFLLFAKYRHDPDTATLSILKGSVLSPAGTDSSLYLNMGDAAFRAPGHRIFPRLFFEQHQKFIYPPSSLFLIEALNLTPSPAKIRELLLLLSWAGVLVLAVIFYRRAGRRVTLPEAAQILLLGALFLPNAEALYRGQVQILLTSLWGCSAVLWQRERRGLAGFMLALTCVFKPQLALFLVWGALRKEWRFTAAMGVTFCVITICSVAHFGLQNNLDYLAVLSYLSKHGEALWANQSVNGIVNRLLRNGDAVGWQPNIYPPFRPVAYFVSTGFALVGVCVGLLLPWRMKWTGTLADFLFFGGISVVISPIAWEHHYGIFLFAVVYLLARMERFDRTRYLLLVAATLAMANRIPPLDHRFMGPQALIGAYLFYSGLVVLAILAVDAGEEASTLTSRPLMHSP